MATGFKQATVNASSVPATQTNFPSYVDLSRLGITTLAEAQSVRVYADSGKTTEWARDIVSASVMWVKVPSLTSTVTIYVDYDGSRADYSVTDTYGRNAVWSAYLAVWHLGDTTDSTGNGNTITWTGSPSYAAAQIGNGVDLSGTGQYGTITLSSSVSNTGYQLSSWISPDVLTTRYGVFSLQRTGNLETDGAEIEVGTGNGGSGRLAIDINAWWLQTANSIITTSAQQHIVVQVFGTGTTDRKFYVNATDRSTTPSGTLTAQTLVAARIGCRYNSTTASQLFNGKLNEMRLKTSQDSANWITTEHNNQSDESGFWGTWTDVSGGTPTFIPKIIMY